MSSQLTVIIAGIVLVVAIVVDVYKRQELVPCSCGAVAMLCSNLDCLNCFEKRMP